MSNEDFNFVDYALNPDLDEAGAYTVCRLIDFVGCSIREDWDWDWLDRESGPFKPLLEPRLVEDAWAELRTREWISLQSFRDDETKITDLEALRGLESLRWLVIQGNAVSNLTPIGGLRRLGYLNCYGNKIRDLTPLTHLSELEDLTLGRNRFGSLTALSDLPSLRTLSLDRLQVRLLEQCGPLKALLTLSVGEVDEVSLLPDMPSLQRLDIGGVGRLDGVDRYSNLQDLELRNGRFDTVQQLSACSKLTHLRISTDRPLDLNPLSSILTLRSLDVQAPKIANIANLSNLPALHELRVIDDAREPQKEAVKIARELSSWDVEFQQDDGDLVPSLAIESLDPEAYERFGRSPHGIAKNDANLGMLQSERGWLMGKIKSALTVSLEEDEDIEFPGVGGMTRSECVGVYTKAAYDSFREIVLKIQAVLCEFIRPWVVFFESLLVEGPDADELPDDFEDFEVWIYPNKIVVEESRVPLIEKLINWCPSN